jgi:lipoprotein-anchoring transpeptidase ErfK/SrfK
MPPVAVRVRSAAFTVEVLVDGAVAARMPAGLGRGGATPMGLFTVGTKLDDPVWYNRGDPIPSGDPRNPLGGHWLGLADASGNVPYGFHDIQGEDDLGRAVSRGCIRLRPQDAERLSRLVPVGTPVYICE